jgi:hypothetical protein
MLTRIALGLAIAVGCGAFVLAHMKVAPKIAGLEEEKTQLNDSLTKSRDAETKAKKGEREAKTALEGATKELDTTKANLETSTAKLTEQAARAAKLEADLNKTTQERNDAQSALASWKALGIPVDQIKTMQVDLRQSKSQVAALEVEKQTLLFNNRKLTNELARFIDPNNIPDLPPGLKGKVVAVDPKWNFVVLDIGGSQGVLENAEMLVNRNGKLVAKVRITSVRPNSSVANILPAWAQADVMEGDQVITR